MWHPSITSSISNYYVSTTISWFQFWILSNYPFPPPPIFHYSYTTILIYVFKYICDYYGWKCVLAKFICWSLTSLTCNVTVFADRVLQEVIKSKWQGLVCLEEEEIWTQRDTGNVCKKKSPCENIARRWPSANQGNMTHNEINFAHVLISDSQLWKYEKISICCLNYSVCTILLW